MKIFTSRNGGGWVRLGQEIADIGGKQYWKENGKWYDESLKEIPNPNLPKSKAVMGVIFTEGEEYENWFGTYRVLKILDDKMMQVEYLNVFKPQVHAGEIKIYPMLAQAETIQNAKEQSDAELAKALHLNDITHFEQPDEFFTLGYIASHGYVSAEIGPKFHKSFPLMFQKITGELPESYRGSGYKDSDNPDRWSYTLRVTCPPPSADVGEQLELPQGYIVRPKSGVEINNGSFVWGLFGIGFRPGKNDARVQEILSHIPADAHAAFMAGFNS